MTIFDIVMAMGAAVLQLFAYAPSVRYWHLADIPLTKPYVGT